MMSVKPKYMLNIFNSRLSNICIKILKDKGMSLQFKKQEALKGTDLSCMFTRIPQRAIVIKHNTDDRKSKLKSKLSEGPSFKDFIISN